MATPSSTERIPSLGALEDLVDGVGDHGGALVLCGEPGIGKSALLAMANRHATDRGMQVLAATGVQSEAHLPFTGLHQLLRPIIAGATGLPVRQRMALLAAFGMADVAAPDRFIIALAALELLADTDTRQLHAMAPGLVDQTIERAGGNRKDPMHRTDAEPPSVDCG
jgi:hypothetical protein